MLRYCFSQFRSKIINFKERLFTLETNMEQADTLPLLNANLQAFLQEKVHDHLMVLKNYDHSQIFARLKLEISDHNDDQLIDNTIKFLSLQMFNKQFIEEIQWLAKQPIQSELQQLMFMQFYFGMIVNNRKIYQQTSTKFNTLLVQIMDYCFNKKKQPQLDQDSINKLREYLQCGNDALVCYASLFLSKYDSSISSFPQYNCYPEILLILLQEQDLQENQLNFILSQCMQSMTQWHLYHFSALFKYLSRLKPSPLLKELIQKAYVQRIEDQNGNTQFDFRVLKNYVQLAQQNEAIGSVEIYLNILQRVSQLAIKHDYDRKQLNDVIRVVYFGIRSLTFEADEKFDDIPKLLLQNSDLKMFLEEWLVHELTLESISIIGLFKLNIPKGFCLRYLTKLKLQEKHFRSVLRTLNQITYFELTDEVAKIIEQMVLDYQIDYLRLLQPNILASYSNIKPIVKAIISTSQDDTVIEYICKNHQFIKNNKSICEQIGMDFSNQIPYIKFKIDAELTGKVNCESLFKLLNAYDIIATFDDELINQIKKAINQMTPSQVGQLLGACEQLRDKLQGFDQLQQFQGKNNFVDIYLNHKGEISTSIQSIDDIILANSQCVNLNYHKAKKLKISLLYKLQNITETPTPKQAYEIVMGWRAKDFEPEQYENYLKYIKDDVKNLDFHHTFKLINKLVQQHQLNVGILLQAYIKLQNVLQSNLNEQNDKISILKLAIILKRIYPTLYLNLQKQESQEGELVNQIIENYYFNKGNNLQLQDYLKKYKQFLPHICDLRSIVSEYTQLEDQLNIAEFLYINNLKVKVNQEQLFKVLEQPIISLLQLYKVTCLVALQDDPEIYKQLLKSNFSRIDPFTNYLFQDDLVICFDVLKKLFPTEPIAKKLESIAIQTCSSFYEPTLTYLFTEGLLTNRTISILEERCIEKTDQ